MVQMAPMHEQLTLAQKVEVFEFALENTTGLDLYKVRSATFYLNCPILMAAAPAPLTLSLN